MHGIHLLLIPICFFSVVNGLFYPVAAPPIAPYLDMKSMLSLSFDEAPAKKFPALSLGYHVLKGQWQDAAVFNAANDISVENFLKKKISFSAIVETVECVLSKMSRMFCREPFSLDGFKTLDTQARYITQDIINEGCEK